MDITNLLYKKFGKVLLSPKEVSEIIQRSKMSLARDRANGTGITYVKLGDSENSKVLYHIDDIVEYIESKKVICK